MEKTCMCGAVNASLDDLYATAEKIVVMLEAAEDLDGDLAGTALGYLLNDQIDAAKRLRDGLGAFHRRLIAAGGRLPRRPDLPTPEDAEVQS